MKMVSRITAIGLAGWRRDLLFRVIWLCVVPR